MRSKIKYIKNLIDLLEENFDNFTPTQKRIAQYLLSNRDEASFLTADEIATQIDTVPSTVVRFAKDIGYDGYTSLQKDLRKLIMKKINNIGQLEKAKKYRPPEKETVISLSFAKNLANLHKLIKDTKEEDIKKFVDFFIAGRNKYITANRSAFSLGHFFFFQTRKIVPNVFLLNNLDDGIFDIIREIDKEDILVAISFPRYAKLTLNLAQHASKKGTKVLSITHNKISPLCKVSEMCLYCPYEGSTFHNSNVAAMSLLEAIIAEIFSHKRDLSIQLLEREEEILLDFNVIELSSKNILKRP